MLTPKGRRAGALPVEEVRGKDGASSKQMSPLLSAQNECAALVALSPPSREMVERDDALAKKSAEERIRRLRVLTSRRTPRSRRKER